MVTKHDVAPSSAQKEHDGRENIQNPEFLYLERKAIGKEDDIFNYSGFSANKEAFLNECLLS